MSLDVPLVEGKLADIAKYLDKLEPSAALSRTEFASTNAHYQAERFVELIVGAALDVNFHLIRVLNLESPVKYRDSFTILGTAGVLATELATRIADSAGLRNLLVHHYDEVDLDRFHAGLKGGIADYRQYVREIFRYLGHGDAPASDKV